MENRNSRIKKALEDAGVSQGRLAKHLGISSQTVNERINSDKEIDSYNFIEHVAQLTGKSMASLYHGYELEGMVEEPDVRFESKVSRVEMLLGFLIKKVEQLEKEIKGLREDQMLVKK